PRERWINTLLENGIPAGPINDVGTALYDPHVLARGMVAEAEHSNGETLRYVASPLKLSETPAEMRTPPPLLGQHTDEILTDLLNLNPADINAYKQQGVI
ncbi:MAG: CoA transferase, partial [Chloroflexota bacterium]